MCKNEFTGHYEITDFAVMEKAIRIRGCGISKVQSVPAGSAANE